MKVVKVAFLLLHFGFCICLGHKKSSSCVKVDCCNCKYQDGRSASLKSVIENSPQGWTVSDKSNNSIVNFHPCTDHSYGEDIANNSCYRNNQLCTNNTKTNYTSLGNCETMDFVETMQGGLRLKYTTEEKVISCVDIRCWTKKMKFEQDNNLAENCNYSFILDCPDCCTRGEDEIENLSTGSVLVIILLVFSTLYFVGGALVLKFIRGAVGRELIPNYAFWSDLPNLVWDGTMFSLNSFRPLTSYDRI